MKKMLALSLLLFAGHASAVMKVGFAQVAIATSTNGTADLTDTNAGFSSDVKAAICSLGPTTNDTKANGYEYSFGYTTPSESVTEGASAVDAGNPVGSGIVWTYGNLAILEDSAYANKLTVSLDSFLSNGIRVKTGTADGVAHLMQCMLLGGDIEAKSVKGIMAGGNPNKLTIAHGMGGTPTVVIVIPNGDGSTNAVIPDVTERLGFDFWDSVNGNVGVFRQNDAGVSPAQIIHTWGDGAGTGYQSTSGTIRVDYTDDTNIRFGSNCDSCAYPYVAALLLRATSGTLVAKVGKFATATGTGINGAISGMSGTPNALLTFQSVRTSSTGEATDDTADNFGFGMAVVNGSGVHQGSLVINADDNIATSDTASYISNTKVVNLTTSSGALDVEGTAVQTVDGWSINYSNAGASGFYQGYLAFGSGAVADPGAFTFTDATGQAINSVIESNAITVTSVNQPVPVAVGAGADTGCEYKINSGSYTASPGTVVVNDTVTAHVTSSGSSGVTTNCPIDIGLTPVSDTFSVTTGDLTPNAFSFVDQTGVALNTVITSASVTITGIDGPAAVTATGGTCSANGGGYSASCGNIANGQAITARHTSSGLNATAVDTVVCVGPSAVCDTFTSTTVNTGGVAPAYVPRLSNDAFTAADATPLEGHPLTLDVTTSGWHVSRVYSSHAPLTPTIQSNKASLPDFTAVVTNVGTSNQWVDVDWTPTAASNNAVDLLMRYTDSQNRWMCGVLTDGTSGLNYLSLDAEVAGVHVASATLNYPALPLLTLGDTYRVASAAYGDSVWCGIKIGSVWSSQKITSSALVGVTNAGVGNEGSAGQGYAATVVDDLNIMQTYSAFDPTTLRMADDPTGFYYGLNPAAGTFYALNPRGLPDHTPIDLQYYGKGSFYINPTNNFVGVTTWTNESYNPTSNTIDTLTHTHTTNPTGAAVAPTFGGVPDQTCVLGTDPGPFDITQYITNPTLVSPTPTADVSGGALVLGRVLNAAGVISGSCLSAAGSPVSVTVRFTNSAGNATDTFLQTVTTITDTTPDAFAFASQNDVAKNTTISSEAVAILGINAAADVTVSGDAGCKWSKNGGGYGVGAGTVVSGDTISVQVTSSNSDLIAKRCSATVGGVIGTLTATTGAATPPATDLFPDQFFFVDVTNVPKSTVMTSSSILVTGIDASVAISVINGEYEKNGSGIWTAAPGTVVANNTVRVRGTSSSSQNSAANVTLTIGSVSDVFTMVTGAGSGCTDIPVQRVLAGQTLFVDMNAFCTDVDVYTPGAIPTGFKMEGSVFSSVGPITVPQRFIFPVEASGPAGTSTARITVDVGGGTSGGGSRGVFHRAYVH